jgi:putative PIN family toxin of toxin-antitoxin system
MRVTLDTNQLIRALMRPPQLATFVMAWEARRFTVVSSQQLLDEFQFVIAEPDVAELIYPELRRLFFGHLLPEIELVELPTIPQLCRDPDDDKVIATALYGGVDYLATADEDIRTNAISVLLHQAGITLTTLDEIVVLLDTEQRR